MTTGGEWQGAGALLATAATALARRQALDVEIAKLVADPMDPAGPDRLRAAQSRARHAGEELSTVRALHDEPPWETASVAAASVPGTAAVNDQRDSTTAVDAPEEGVA